MTRKFRVIAGMVLGALMAVALLTGAGRLLASTQASDPVPEIVNYQGYLTDAGGNPISGTVSLEFKIYDASSGGNELWAETHISVPVSGGFFSVFLGGEGNPLTPSVFNGTSRYLQVTYNGTTFARQRFASVPYALVSYRATQALNANQAVSSTYAMTAAYALNGPSNGSSGGSVEWQYVKVVAKSGGDYTTITEAMNAITPTSSSRYLVLVMPGVYEEQVTLKEYVHLKGAGRNMTVVSSASTSGSFNDNAAATMLVPANTQVSHLTVRNVANTSNAVGLKVTSGNEDTILDDVGVEVTGAGGDHHIGLYLSGSAPKVLHSHVEVSGATLPAINGGFNRGINSNGSEAVIHDTTVLANGINASGLALSGGGMKIQDSNISGTNGADGKGVTTFGGSGDPVYIDRSSIEGDLTGNAILSTDDIQFYVGASLLKGSVLTFNANNNSNCAANYDENYDALNATCQ